MIKCFTIIQIELESWNVGFWREGKTGVLGEKSLGVEQSRAEGRSGNRTRHTALVGGERSHPYAIPAPPLALPWGQYYRLRIHAQPLKSILLSQHRCFGNYRTFQSQGRYLFSGLLPTRFSPPHCGENCIGLLQDNVFERCSGYIGERHHTHSLAVVEFHYFAYPTS